MEELLNELHDGLYYGIYGIEVLKLKDLDISQAGDIGFQHKKATLVKVLGISLGRKSNQIVELEPFYLIVSGGGKKVTSEDNTFSEDAKYWVMRKDALTVRMEPESGQLEALLEEEIKGLVKLKLKSGLSISIETRDDLKICLKYNIWLKLKWKGPIGGWQKGPSVSFGGRECIGIDNCVNVFNSEIFRAKLCYYPASNKVCLKAEAGFRGASIKITECSNL